MLRNVEKIKGSKVLATDGEIGSVHDVYFDDEHWTVRYLVVDTGGWLSGRQVLISPMSVRDLADDAVALDLTRERIEHSPGIGTDEPVSRQFEQEYLDFYGYPYYWYGPYPYVWGGYINPAALARSAASHPVTEEGDGKTPDGDPHLRSAREVKGYHIQATDDGVGNVEDLVVDPETWHLSYLVVDTSDWWFGKHVVLAPSAIDRIDWLERKVFVGLSRDQVKEAKEFEAAVLADGSES